MVTLAPRLRVPSSLEVLLKPSRGFLRNIILDLANFVLGLEPPADRARSRKLALRRRGRPQT